MQNMGISDNLHNDKEDGAVNQRGNILIQVEFTMNVIWRPQDLDFSFESIQNDCSIYFSQWIGVRFWEVVGEKGLNLVYIIQCLGYILVANDLCTHDTIEI